MASLVKTDAMCFFGGRRYRPGDVFELPEGAALASYLTVVGEIAPAAKSESKPAKGKGKAAKEPSTFSEIAAQDVAASRPKGVADEDVGRIADLV